MAHGDETENVFLAKLSEQADRFEDMVQYMQAEVKLKNGELGTEERNILSVAFKNVVSSRRASLRICRSLIKKVESTGGTKLENVRTYTKRVEDELKKLCGEILELLDGSLIAKAEGDAEGVVFYMKMKADYYRYSAEVEGSTDGTGAESGSAALKEATAKAHNAYKEATAVAEEKLRPTHPIRLGLALNYSVFLFEGADQQKEACAHANAAFEASIAELDSLTDKEEYHDSTLIMQLLKDNLTLWTSDDEDGADVPEGTAAGGK
mmetsp:Transcript_39932/g.79957  ORF Transcript_39932/g.79957 Transcript_39932/m.79957 type:complete len:265 (-) Transcript_39932:366-1160(-)|eukprot:CAMPEP_0174705348 /NCGR_PEP_ID=MMETSP1094-20130205/8609_1 /TAXON_ID=156173 /ORGANISM="Chrysochromulina brevifilum, Strain UTEX LB 985" /LENGTH=264 /DNA_ID=CAMNT_0015903505 /DNA_START=53 /DNA_END=847 /DNA_ORIENTATION=-